MSDPTQQQQRTQETREQIGARLSVLSMADLRRLRTFARDPVEREVADHILSRRGSTSASAERHAPRSPHAVVVTDVEIPFGSMVKFMVKWSLASIPAAIILIAIYFAAIMAVNVVGEAVTGR